jgi:hypothetical protein
VRILFASTQGGGHVGPLLPFARAAVAAGHEVLLAAPGAVAARTGLPLAPLAQAPDRAVRWAPVFTRNSPGLVYTVQELFIGLDARAALPGMQAAVAAFRPDLIVRETCEFASTVVAERHDIPVVQVGVHMDTTVDTGERLVSVAEPALRALGLRHVERLLEATVLTTVPPSLSADSPRLRRFRTQTPPRLARDLIYVSFGSETPHTPYFPRLYRETIAALPTDRPVVVALGRDPSALGAVPDHVRVEHWVDQDTVLPRAAAMVGHGGSGSTLAALAVGVPIAFRPLFVDGPDNARRVSAAGAGRVVEDDLAGTLARLDARAAERIGSEMAALPAPALPS